MGVYTMFYKNAMPYEGDPRFGVSASGLSMDGVLEEGYNGRFREILHENYETFNDLVYAINHDGWDLPCGVSVKITGAPTLWRVRGEDGAQLGIGETAQLALQRARASWKLQVNQREMFADFANECLKDMTPMEILRLTQDVNRKNKSGYIVMPVVYRCALWLGGHMVDEGLESMKVGRFFLERERLIPKENDERRWATSEY